MQRPCFFRIPLCGTCQCTCHGCKLSWPICADKLGKFTSITGTFNILLSSHIFCLCFYFLYLKVEWIWNELHITNLCGNCFFVHGLMSVKTGEIKELFLVQAPFQISWGRLRLLGNSLNLRWFFFLKTFNKWTSKLAQTNHIDTIARNADFFTVRTLATLVSVVEASIFFGEAAGIFISTLTGIGLKTLAVVGIFFIARHLQYKLFHLHYFIIWGANYIISIVVQCVCLLWFQWFFFPTCTLRLL